MSIFRLETDNKEGIEIYEKFYNNISGNKEDLPEPDFNIEDIMK